MDDRTLLELIFSYLPPTLETFGTFTIVSKLFRTVATSSTLFTKFQSSAIVCCLGKVLRFGRADWDILKPLFVLERQDSSSEAPTREEWQLIFKRLNIDPQKSRVLIGENPVFIGKLEKEKLRLLKILFEEFGVLGVSVVSQDWLLLCSAGYNSGIVIQVLSDSSRITPVLEGIVQYESVVTVPVGLDHITKELCSRLQKRGYAYYLTKDKAELEAILNQHCFVSVDIDKDLALTRETTALSFEYQSNRFGKVVLDEESFMAPEVVFQQGLSDAFFSCWSAIDVGSKFYMRKILIYQEGSFLPGLGERLEKDSVANCLKKYHRIKSSRFVVRTLKHHAFSGALGHLQRLDGTSESYLTRKEYLFVFLSFSFYFILLSFLSFQFLILLIYDEKRMRDFCNKVGWHEFIFGTLLNLN